MLTQRQRLDNQSKTFRGRASLHDDIIASSGGDSGKNTSECSIVDDCFGSIEFARLIAAAVL
jgi:hypothetical protein